MLLIDDLVGIPEDKRRQAIECLDDLLTFKDEEGRLSPVISGYNWYKTVPKSKSTITLSNIHETEAYKRDMLKDLSNLGYNPKTISEQIRAKAGAFLYNPKYRIRDDKGALFSGLKIKDIRTEKYLELEKFKKPLVNYPQFKKAKGYLIEEDQGWELDMPFDNKDELMSLVSLFLRKSGMFIYDEVGTKILETLEEKELRAPWADVYRTPVLLLGEYALKYYNELPQFDIAIKICLIENHNEISFIIHEKLEFLRNTLHYELLNRLGFNEEVCLGNKPFLIDVDRTR